MDLTNLPLWLTFLGPILVALVMSIPGIISLRRQLKKDTSDVKKQEVEASKLIQEAALDLLEPYQERVEILTKKVKVLEGQAKYHNMERGKLQKRVTHLEGGVAVLIRQLEELGIIPEWTPNGDSEE